MPYLPLHLPSDLRQDIFSRNAVGVDRVAAINYIQALPPTVTLALARRWIELNDDRAGVAAGLLALHSEADDLDRIQQAFADAWAHRLDFGSMYSVCSLVDALGRLDERGPYAELTMAFEEVEYSYARRRAAEALHRCDASFSKEYGRECLWDCEAETRMLGTTAAPASHSVMRRLDQLGRNQLEESALRAAAIARLQANADDALDAMTADFEERDLYE